MILTNPTINVDSQFQVLKNCACIPTGWIVGDTTQRDYTGGLHVNSVFRKETFQLVFNNLSEQLTDLIEQIFMTTGVNVFHKVEAITPKIRRIWDGTTAAGSGTNIDVNRVRNKVYMSKFSKVHYDGNPNVYQVIIDCEET